MPVYEITTSESERQVTTYTQTSSEKLHDGREQLDSSLLVAH